LERRAVKIRGYAALGLIGLTFPFLDLFQRTVISGWVLLRPSARIPVLGWWINRMRAWVVWCLERVGGASIPMPDRIIPSGPGTLIVMNHQSVLDIPLVVGAVKNGYPRIVTRARYHRFIPLISQMVRLYQYPIVDPRAKSEHVQKSLVSLGEAAVDSDVPIAIFPEGTRTRNGEVGRFRTRGLESLLSGRSWTVHLLVADGYWRSAKLKDFVRGMDHIGGAIRYVGTEEWTDPSVDPSEFIDHLRNRLIEGLAELRGESADDPARSTGAGG
jgi:1-acyl-sn-glycerol-3-phosphate acyltransferase